ncbi:MAG: alanyl-tRNA editing protein [Candidatus Heimdallarchaeota archaeon]|nr:alanyl-tRNA editing protein [Candidatus Heimdallarchaeota archaeon]MBY8993715.1 alanyl-tRNA editing protein [Candidatus Heimdallarchaeota archaeon]
MQTNLLYMTDSYLREFDAIITNISEDGMDIYIDRTAFFPGGGGQPYDEGKLIINNEEYSVVKIGRDSNRALYHRVDRPLEADVGSKVKGEIDWERRYKIMRYHTALHILCGLIWKEFGASVTGGNMSPDKARMDFNLADFSKERVEYIEKRVAEEVAAARDIVIKILPREEAFQIPDLIRTKINLLPPQIKEVRTVEIVGLDLQADGGTHLKNTRDVGTVKIIETINKGKENKRIVIKIED